MKMKTWNCESTCTSIIEFTSWMTFNFFRGIQLCFKYVTIIDCIEIIRWKCKYVFLQTSNITFVCQTKTMVFIALNIAYTLQCNISSNNVGAKYKHFLMGQNVKRFQKHDQLFIFTPSDKLITLIWVIHHVPLANRNTWDQISKDVVKLCILQWKKFIESTTRAHYY